jgi:hypothetical protein
MTAVLWWAVPTLLAYAGLYRAADRTTRHALRLTGAAALWATSLALIITWR